MINPVERFGIQQALEHPFLGTAAMADILVHIGIRRRFKVWFCDLNFLRFFKLFLNTELLLLMVIRNFFACGEYLDSKYFLRICDDFF